MPGYYGSKIRSWFDSQLQSVLYAGEEEYIEEWNYASTHPLGHTRPVTGSIYL
jgi:hypothetical protein